ncbi:MAG: hypothetical protein ACPLVI_05940 [Thermoplasmata archaeon]
MVRIEENRELFENLKELERINEELAKLKLKKKEISENIINSSKGNEIAKVESLFGELGENEERVRYLTKRKEEILENIKNSLKSFETLVENFNIFCDYNGTISVMGLPGTGKLEMIMRFLAYCKKRDSFVVVLRDRERVMDMVRRITPETTIITVNPVYVEKVSDIRKLEQVSRLASRLSKDIMKVVRGRRNPLIVIHRSNDLSLDRINEVSGFLKEEFWRMFMENISPMENNMLLIFNCDSIGDECSTLMTFSDYLVRVELAGEGSRFMITRLRL